MQDSINNSPYQATQGVPPILGASTPPSVATQPSLDMGVQPSKFSKFNLKQNKFKLKIVLPIILLFLVVGAVLAGMTLVQTSQDVRQQASGGSNPGYSCGSLENTVERPAPNSSACTWGGATYYKCHEGFHADNNGCARNSSNPSIKPSIKPSIAPSIGPSVVPTIKPFSTTGPVIIPGVPEDPNSCGTGNGLFSGYVPNSVDCLWNGAPYYKCDDSKGYINDDNNGCKKGTISIPWQEDVGTCGSITGLLAEQVDNSEPCSVGDAAAEVLNQKDFFKCVYNHHNENHGCVPDSSGQTYRVAGELPYGEFCEPCPDSSQCGYSLSLCEAQVASLYGNQECHEIGNCYVGYFVPVGTCGAYPDVTTCREAEDAEAAALADSQMCWSLSSNCAIGWAPVGQESCDSGTFPSVPLCIQALTVKNSIFGPAIEALGSLSLDGARVGGE